MIQFNPFLKFIKRWLLIAAAVLTSACLEIKNELQNPPVYNFSGVQNIRQNDESSYVLSWASALPVDGSADASTPVEYDIYLQSLGDLSLTTDVATISDPKVPVRREVDENLSPARLGYLVATVKDARTYQLREPMAKGSVYAIQVRMRSGTYSDANLAAIFWVHGALVNDITAPTFSGLKSLDVIAECFPRSDGILWYGKRCCRYKFF
jgi:hypothetical protein